MRRGEDNLQVDHPTTTMYYVPPHSLYKSTKTKKEDLKSETSKHFHIELKYFLKEHFFKTIIFFNEKFTILTYFYFYGCLVQPQMNENKNSSP